MKDKLNDLVNVGLIDTLGRTKVQKGDATTPIYQYNGLAYLLAWLIESFDPNKRELANNEIYNLLDANFKALASLEEIEEMGRQRSHALESLEIARFARQPYQQEANLIFVFLSVMRIFF